MTSGQDSRGYFDEEVVELWYSRRRNLRGVPARAGIKSLRLFESTLDSLEGLEEMTALEELRLVGTQLKGDLRPLLALPNLRHLVVHVRGVADYRPLSELVLLESLELSFARTDQLRHVEEIDFERLSCLRVLALGGDKPFDIGLPFDLRFLGGLRGLHELRVRGLRPHDGRLDFLSGLTELRRLELLATSEAQLTELRERLPSCELDVMVNELLGEPTREPDLKVGMVEAHGPNEDGEWSIFQDLAPYLDTDTNHEAEQVVRRQLKRHEPGLLSRLSFDSEADAVGIYARSKEDAHTVAELIDRLAQGRATE